VVLCVSCFAPESVAAYARAALPGLRRARRRARLSQAGLGTRSGLSTLTISRAERGGPVLFATVQKLAAALGVEPCELIEPPPPAG
jgi:transcriptional regulator with XRE-family HTH domain